eukprot:m51a1_g12295 hypothetical protein (619) ;mRNA; f:318779-321401
MGKHKKDKKDKKRAERDLEPGYPSAVGYPQPAYQAGVPPNAFAPSMYPPPALYPALAPPPPPYPAAPPPAPSYPQQQQQQPQQGYYAVAVPAEATVQGYAVAVAAPAQYPMAAVPPPPPQVPYPAGVPPPQAPIVAYPSLPAIAAPEGAQAYAAQQQQMQQQQYQCAQPQQMQQQYQYTQQQQGLVPQQPQPQQQQQEGYWNGADQDQHVYERFGSYMVHNMMGLRPIEEMQVPQGHHVEFDKKGQRFLVKNEPEKTKAVEEPPLRFLAKESDVLERYGNGIVLYFHFLNFVIKTNVWLFFLSLISFAPHVVIDVVLEAGWNTMSSSSNDIVDMILSNIQGGRKLFYLSSYSERLFSAWFISVILAALSALFIGYFLFLVMLAVSAACTMVWTILEMTFLSSRIASLGLAIFIFVVRIIWGLIVLKLTNLEKHRSWGSFKKHMLMKTYLFKVFNLLIVYVCRWLVPRYDIVHTFFSTIHIDKSPDVVIEDRCGLVALGDQFLMFLAVDLIVSNIIELVLPPLKAALSASKGTTPEKPEFDLAEEYLEIIYRQFMIYLAFPYFPMITLLGVFGNLLEVVIDRYRLFRVCKKPPRLDGSMKTQNTFFLFMNALFAIASFP